MTPEQVNAAFEKTLDDGEYLKFDRVENKRSQRPDMHAFLLLDALVPGKGDMVAAAEHDQFYLATDIVKFCEVATDAVIVELSRCGVSVDEDTESLYMFT